MSFWSAVINRAPILEQRCLSNIKAPFQCLKQCKRHNQPDLRGLKAKAQLRNRKKGYSLLFIPAAAFCLGVWQVRRRQWKIELIENLESKLSKEPVTLPENYKELDAMDYHRVKVTGKFDHSGEVYILPRANIRATDSGSSNSGAYVVTPFQLENNDVILVNRGWVPKGKMDPNKRLSGQVEGTVEISGIIRKTEMKSNYMSDHGSSNIWHIRDVEGIAKATQTLPIFIDADFASTVEGGPIGGQTKVTLRNDHLQYLITWFTVSAATLFMWIKWFAKRH